MTYAAQQAAQRSSTNVRAKVAAIDWQSPREIDARLVQLGYRGQEAARRAAAVLAYRHAQRLRRQYVKELPPVAMARECSLWLGPTGCGKTFLLQLLFQELLGVPTVIADATTLSETGYVGDDVSTLLSRLFEAAGGDLEWAACGVVCLDEFDKLATARSDSRFAGEQTTKDVSGLGVQRSLLTLLSAPQADFQADFGYTSRLPPQSMSLHNVTIVACGAFSGLKTTALKMDDGAGAFGFGNNLRARATEAIAEGLDDEHLELTRAFARYGFLPELIGRFNRLLSFEPLGRQTLSDILEHSVIKDYEREFESEDLRLVVEPGLRERIVDSALRRETGARGLRAALGPVLERAAFERFGGREEGAVVRVGEG